MNANDVDAVRALVARERHGALSTAHADMKGWPFGSVTPYALSSEGDPVLLLSAIAEHTRNLAVDPRASLLVQDSRSLDRPQAGARATLLARAEVPLGDEARASREAYLARFPEAESYASAHDFAVHVLRVERVRWIAGFGTMGWLERGEWVSPPAVDPLAPHAAALRDHMNRDHPDALVELAAWAEGVPAKSARVTRLDSQGFDLVVEEAAGGERSFRVPFPAPAPTPRAVRDTFVAMLAKARARST